MRKLTQIHIYPEPPQHASEVHSGVDRYLYYLKRHLSVELVTFPDRNIHANRCPTASTHSSESAEVVSGSFFKQLIQSWTPASFYLICGYLSEIRSLRSEMRHGSQNRDLIHVNRVGCEVQPIAARLAGFKHVVTTVHNLPGEDATAMHWVRRCVEYCSFFAADSHICVSEATYDAWQARVGLKRSKVEIIYNGMEIPDYSDFDVSGYRRKLIRGAENAIWIGICARLHPMKGHKVLLEAFADLLQQSEVCPVVLVIAGDGSLYGELLQQTRDLGIDHAVFFLGHRSDAIEFARAIDINVLPSIHSETLGYSFIEAMFAARPSVVSDVGGMKELVRASGSGRVVPAGDVPALTQALLKYVVDPGRAREEGEQAQKFALKNLTAQKMADTTQAVYAEFE